MVENVREQRLEDVRARQTADILDKLSRKDDRVALRIQKADERPDAVEHKAGGRHISLAELLCERPHREDADSHRNSANDRHEHLRASVVVAAEHIVAEIDERNILHACAEVVDQEIQHDHDPEPVVNDGADLLPHGDPLLRLIPVLLRDPLLREIVLHQRERQGERGNKAHHHNPFALIDADCRQHEHREEQRNDNARDHRGRDIRKDGELAALLRDSRRERHHEVVTHVVDRIGKGPEQVVGNENPDRLRVYIHFRHRKGQDSRHSKERRADKQPRSRLALPRVCPLDNLSHDDIRARIQNLAADREDREKHAAPDRRQMKNIRIKDIEICGEHRVQKKRARRTDEIAQPFFFPCYISVPDPAVQRRIVPKAPFHIYLRLCR